MKLPPELIKYDGKVADGDDNSLVKMRTLKAWAAAIVSKIPRSGGGFSIRRSSMGDVWTAGTGSAVEDTPWKIDATGHINPGLVGIKMPTLGGEPLDTTANVLDLSQDGDYVWFQLNFTVGWVSSYLASAPLASVSIGQGATVPTADADTKYLVFNRISGGAPASPSYFNRSISVRLVDAGISATSLEYNS